MLGESERSRRGAAVDADQAGLRSGSHRRWDGVDLALAAGAATSPTAVARSTALVEEAGSVDEQLVSRANEGTTASK